MFHNPPSIGLDIGSHSIKVVVLRRKKQQFILDACFEAVTKLPILTEQHTLDSDALLSVLRQFKATCRPRGRHTSVALPDSAVISKEIVIDDAVDDDELAFAIAGALAKASPLPVEELSFDYYPIDSPAIGQSYQVIAARKEAIDCRVEALKAVKLDARVIELKSNALRWLVSQRSEPDIHPPVIGVIDIGKRFSCLSVSSPSAARFCREWAFGCEWIEQNQSASAEPHSIAMTQQLAEHLKRQLQFYHSSHPSEPLEQLLICGGGANLIDTVLLAELVALEVTSFSPIHDVRVSDPKGIAPFGSTEQFAVAMGLAIRGAA